MLIIWISIIVKNWPKCKSDEDFGGLKNCHGNVKCKFVAKRLKQSVDVSVKLVMSTHYFFCHNISNLKKPRKP